MENLLSPKVIKNERVLKALSTARAAARRTYIQTAKKEVILTLIECAKKILIGQIPLTAKQHSDLKRYADHIKLLVSGNRSRLEEKRAILQQGGFLPLLIRPILSVLGGVLGPILGGGRR